MQGTLFTKRKYTRAVRIHSEDFGHAYVAGSHEHLYGHTLSECKFKVI